MGKIKDLKKIISSFIEVQEDIFSKFDVKESKNMQDIRDSIIKLKRDLEQVSLVEDEFMNRNKLRFASKYAPPTESRITS